MGTPTYTFDVRPTLPGADEDQGFVDCRGEWHPVTLETEIDPC